MVKYLFLAFVVVSPIEIFLITQVANQIAWPLTIVLVIGVSLLGAYLVKREGLNVINRVRQGFTEMRMPTNELADGAMIFFASALMLTPGFLTDALGLALLIPPIRALFRPPVIAFFTKRLDVKVQGLGGPAGFGANPFGARGGPAGPFGANPFGARGPGAGRNVYDADASRPPADADLTDITPDPRELPDA